MSFALRSDLQLLNHPFYQAWMRGALTHESLADYACQYSHHVSAFPGYLELAITKAPNQIAKEILLDQLAEENGQKHGVSHPELWIRFSEGLGVKRSELQGHVPREAIQNLMQTLFDFCKSSWPEALGSLYAYESQVPEVATSKIKGLVEHYQISDARSLEFFAVHQEADVIHRQVLLSLMHELPTDKQAKAQLAMEQTAQSLLHFLTEVQQCHNIH